MALNEGSNGSTVIYLMRVLGAEPRLSSCPADGDQISAAWRMDWIQSQWSDNGTDEKTIAITTYLKPTTDMTAKNRSHSVTTKTEVDSEKPLALLVTTSMVEVHMLEQGQNGSGRNQKKS